MIWFIVLSALVIVMAIALWVLSRVMRVDPDDSPSLDEQLRDSEWSGPPEGWPPQDW